MGNLFALDLNLDELEEVRGKNSKGESQWQAPNEWADGPSAKREEPRQSQDQPGTWNAADYDMVMDKLRKMRR